MGKVERILGLGVAAALAGAVLAAIFAEDPEQTQNLIHNLFIGGVVVAGLLWVVWDRLFGKREEPPPRSVAELFAGRTRPAVHLQVTEEEEGSYFGGLPALPAETPWPDNDGMPLAFLASIDLAELAVQVSFDWLPSSGQLMFFYDMARMPWGFDPNDRGGWKVLYAQQGVSLEPTVAPVGLDPAMVLPRRGIRFRYLDHPPSSQHESLDELSDREADAYCDARDALFGERIPRHQMGGFPDPIQNDTMQLECQLASHGVDCGTPKGWESQRAKALGPGAADWRLLLQFDSDDDLDVMWGDAGMLYFWIREYDARQLYFSKTWLILQCG